METKIYGSELEDFIKNFREYKIENEENYKAAQEDFRLSKTGIDEISVIMEAVLLLINDTKQHQITKIAYEFLLISLVKQNITLFRNILEYQTKIS